MEEDHKWTFHALGMLRTGYTSEFFPNTIRKNETHI
jgi:hypothetical protein